MPLTPCNPIMSKTNAADCRSFCHVVVQIQEEFAFGISAELTRLRTAEKVKDLLPCCNDQKRGLRPHRLIVQ